MAGLLDRRGFFAVACLLIATLLLSVSSSGAVHNNLRILYVVTDEYDEMYLNSFIRMYGNYLGDVVSLDDVADVDLDLYDVVVLVDPNWLGPEKVGDIANKILDYAASGGRVVATLNGVSLLSLSTKWRSIVETSFVEGGDVSGLYDYNVSKYKFAYIESPLILYQDKLLSLLEIGEGFVVCIKLNTVWVYADTKNPFYLDLLAKSLEILANTKHRAGSMDHTKVLTAIAIAFTATLAGNARSFRESAKPSEKARPVIAPLWSRISYEEVLSHPVRKAIFEKLLEIKAATFNELMESLKISKAVLSWHLYVLEQHGLVKVCRSKRPRKTVVFIPDSEGVRKAGEILGINCQGI